MTVDEVEHSLAALRVNTDATMLRAAAAALKRSDSFPTSDYVIPERTPDATALGRGKKIKQDGIQQFGSGSVFAGENVNV
jgi:hypothetical protein